MLDEIRKLIQTHPNATITDIDYNEQIINVDYSTGHGTQSYVITVDFAPHEEFGL